MKGLTQQRFRPDDSIALLASHLQSARDQRPSQCGPIAKHIFELAITLRVPIDIVTVWIYSQTDWTTGWEFAWWVRESGEVPLDE